MKRYVTAGFSVLVLLSISTALVWMAETETVEAHCQVPCGIYDDAARIRHMREDVTTITKAIDNIRQLAGRHDPQAFNQAVRWVNTKEDHASHIISVVSEYFLTQKVKPVAPGEPGYDQYLKKLADHHAVMAAAMKTKQHTDRAFADSLTKAIDAMAVHYKSK
ncbi:MAG: superoxide dismutase, Ni [Phycisphaerales bacterium]|nr:superoxide dismutase, Ni [Phycisphaerales bacterium]